MGNNIFIIRRGGGSSGSHTITFTSLIPSGNETIAYTGTESGTVNIVNGSGSVLLPAGTYAFTSSNTAWTSGSIAITSDTTINCYYGTPLYWYGAFVSPLTDSWTDSTSSHAVGSTSISVWGAGTSGNIRYSALNSQLDLSGYNTLRTIAYGATTSASYHRVGLASSNSSPKTHLIGTMSIVGTSPATYGLDISQISSGYIAIGGTDPSNSRATYVNALWLE